MIKFKIFIYALMFFVPLMGVITCAKKQLEKRKYFLERVGDFQVVQIYADGFEELSLKEKMLAYYLSQASLAGRDIAYDQNHKNGLEIRKILEGIVTHNEGIDEKIYKNIEDYTKLFWMNNGHYNFINSHKFIPDVSFDEFLSAVKKAVENGADPGLEEGETIDNKLEKLEKIIFDINYQPLKTNKNPPSGDRKSVV